MLVCPSTDPSWTPLFVNAAGLILECGGSLSHGAIVARELGIPAVVCRATRFLREGEQVFVDGEQGEIMRLAAGPAADACASTADDAADVRIPRQLVPPAIGRWERRGAAVSCALTVVWAACLVGVFSLPRAWLYDPTIRSFDMLLWPVLRAWGKPAVVAVAAAALALFTLVGQRLLTDNQRLTTAKRRAAGLRQMAAKLPVDAPRAQALLGLARPVPIRIAMAALLPLTVILGPMVMLFLWLADRVDPASANPRPGATAFVMAGVDGEYIGPITLEHDERMVLDEEVPATQSAPPIRATLSARLAKWQRQGDPDALPQQVQQAGRMTGPEILADLMAYLARGIPPQTLSWTISTPADRAGRFTVMLVAQGAAPVRVPLVLGDAYPPEPKEDFGDGRGPVQVVRPAEAASPIKWVKVRYLAAKTQRQEQFWAPLASWGWTDWDTGWLLTYLLVYLPLMLALRWCLRLP